MKREETRRNERTVYRRKEKERKGKLKKRHEKGGNSEEKGR